jgi:hypothetical protein
MEHFNSVNFLVFSGITLVELLFECLKFESLSPVIAARIMIDILVKKGLKKAYYICLLPQGPNV